MLSVTREQRLQVVEFARAQLGEAYKFLGAGPNVWDCSGLTMRSWQQLPGFETMPHQAAAQITFIEGGDSPFDEDVHWPKIGTVLDWSTEARNGLRLGDLVFVYGDVEHPESVGHVALFAGWLNKQRQIIAAVNKQYGVKQTWIEWGGTPSGVGYIGH